MNYISLKTHKKLFFSIFFAFSFFVTDSGNALASTYYHDGTASLSDANAWWNTNTFDGTSGVLPGASDSGIIGSAITVSETEGVDIDYTLTIASGGNLNLLSGAEIRINDGGTLVNALGGNLGVASGGVISVMSGGVFRFSDLTININGENTGNIDGSGSIVVDAEGYLLVSENANLNVLTEGTLYMVMSGVVGGVEVLDGGTVNISSSSTLTASSGAEFKIADGGSTNVNSLGILYIVSGGRLIVSSGGILDVNDGGVLTIAEEGSALEVIGIGELNINAGAEWNYGGGGTIYISGENVGSVNLDGIVNISTSSQLDISSGSNLNVQSIGTLTNSLNGAINILAGGALSVTGDFVNNGVWTSAPLSSVSVVNGGDAQNNIADGYQISGAKNSAITPYNISSKTASTTANYNAVLANSDADSWSATGLPAGLSIDSSTGIISGTPTSYGTGTIYVTSTDPDDNFSTQAISYSIENVSTPVSSGGGSSGSSSNRNNNTPAKPTNLPNIQDKQIIITTLNTFIQELKKLLAEQGKTLPENLVSLEDYLDKLSENNSYYFTKVLPQGLIDPDVGHLQQFLKRQNLYTGTITNYMDIPTRTALEAFQLKNNIVFFGQVGYGVLGPRTRALINKLQGF